ncbi:MULTISPECIES: NlpC/P60 family protein [Mycobacteriaceae]|uniref:NlpC/P60 family protein n=2 Tax=Mycolicibacterium iranicum TaxID=912594 RepID=A0A178M034_MYCIR|nr:MULTISPECIES: NlpC/P60 family protein [Mycolicibacterium]MCZ0731855.1 NlpC/P60 family protein [Mycolicibacterium iranicum]MDA2894790.1 NlpC/P60 family protein [Mycolicibacterium sp. BiH015]OAN40391.1 hypothetical protein A4X20_14930 [Mycolicibacterium iranicum]
MRASEDAFIAPRSEIDSATDEARTARGRLEKARSTPPPSEPGSWDSAPDTQVTGTEWDTAVPAVPAADLSDPVAIVNSVLQISAASAQVTASLGRQFLVKLGLIAEPSPSVAAVPGQIPRVYGQQAVEFVIRRGMTQLGVPYSWGGGNASGATRGVDRGAGTVGFDCSGLMVFAFAGVGISLPKYSGAQYEKDRRVPVGEMRRGDLIFYGPNGSQHVAIYLGQGQMLESPFTGSQVRIAPVRTSGMTSHVVRLIDY